MIGLISSTIFPSAAKLRGGNSRTVLSPETRLNQTLDTIRTLKDAGVGDIFLFDNSGPYWDGIADSRFRHVNLVKLGQSYNYDNKGISEVQMLLSGIESLPPDVPIMKISGRYALLQPPHPLTNEWDIAGRMYVKSRRKNMSTRMYLARNRQVLHLLLLQTIREMYAYSARIVGPSSLYRFISNQFGLHEAKERYSYEDPHVMLEMAISNGIDRSGFRFCNLDRLFIRGQLGNVDPPKYIYE